MSLKEDNEQDFAKDKVPKIYKGLEVQCIQELLRNDPFHVPEKYLRSHEEMEMEKVMPHISSAIPIIDFSLLSEGNKEELSKLDIACKEWSCFKLVNHGVKKEVIQRMEDAAVEFYSLPIKEKQSAIASDDYLGYGSDPVFSEDQVLEWSDSLLLLISPKQYSNPSAWPKTPKQFKETVKAYSNEFSRVAKELLNYLSMNLGLQKPGLLERHEGGMAFYRANYYPPCTMPEKVLGLNPHSDANSLTFIMSKDDVSALEIKHEGSWVPMNPMSDAVDVLLSDMIEIWSNGIYKSIEHRVVINKNKKRISHTFALAPLYEVEVEPLDNFVDEQNPKLYKKIRYDDYVKLSYKQKQNGKAVIEMVKIKEEKNKNFQN